MEKNKHSLLCLLIVLQCGMALGQKTSNVDELLNWCLDARHHKKLPGPEGDLFKQCTPWKTRSCCTEEVTRKIHEDSLYSFNFNHCMHQTKKEMSRECHRHFKQDHCFYECSPNVGPWVVSEKRSWRKERYFKVPLCASDCEAWFNSCADDYTCTDNWSRNFDWLESSQCTSGTKCKTNFCPKGSDCRTFKEIYLTAQNFCEKVWDDAWEYTNDSSPCMRLWFDGIRGNPNDLTAKHYAFAIAGAESLSGSLQFLIAVIVLIWTVY
nr:folate receptor gamma-like [Penaeus vannamei]XP_027222055.1 folate receptor gamma-like [Penaeus vannamei]XP_027222056.1 folate receptor gamma-like [Penaeus vannamei]